MVLALLRAFCARFPVFLPPQKPTLLNSDSIWKQLRKSLPVGCETSNSYLFYFFIFLKSITQEGIRRCLNLNLVALCTFNGSHLHCSVIQHVYFGQMRKASKTYWVSIANLEPRSPTSNRIRMRTGTRLGSSLVTFFHFRLTDCHSSVQTDRKRCLLTMS